MNVMNSNWPSLLPIITLRPDTSIGKIGQKLLDSKINLYVLGVAVKFVGMNIKYQHKNT